MIQYGFSKDEYDDNFDDDLSQIEPFRPSPGIVIDATRAAQLIMEYCVLLGNGQLFPPRFLFYGHSPPYTCILSMPANCPVRDDIFCKGNRKKIAKYECCLRMVEKLYEKGELNQNCLPNRNRALLEIEEPIEKRLFKLSDTLFGEKPPGYMEKIIKQIATFPLNNDVSLTTSCYLYQINNELGFVIPYKSLQIPKFYIYGPDELIEIIYIKSIDYKQYKINLEEFCQYLFEYVFNDMNIDTILKFDIENSTFKLLPCLLTKSGDIDTSRMIKICNRKDKLIEDYSNLTIDELYRSIDLSTKQLFRYLPDKSLLKRASDPWIYKKESDTIQTYADFFTHKHPKIPVRRDSYLVTIKGVKRFKINYFKDTTTETTPTEKTDDIPTDYVHHPIEHLCYAPLNQKDFELIYKLPTILVRISQLHRIEKLRKLFAKNIRYSLLDIHHMSPVTFTDCLKSDMNSSLLPLVPLTYDNLLTNQTIFQPSSNILFQAITRRSANENVDMENLEILGDCFLKLTVSLSLYHRYPLAGAGALTNEKSKEISNRNLYRLAIQKDLYTYLNALKINFRGEEANWIPPGYDIIQFNHDENRNQLNIERYKYQKVKRKGIADMMEGFIGAFLISTNYSITMHFMTWLGLDVIPKEKEIPTIVCSSIDRDERNRIIENFYHEQAFAIVEETIKYQFNDKAYLIASFTHPSSFTNRLTNCYERLEFLGDAVLDFLVTREIFIKNKDITPGLVTDIRQDLSNNGRLAYILVACGLQTKILHNSPDLFSAMQLYAGNEQVFPKDSSIDTKLNQDINQWADSTAPKALADVFEALVGAIFLDSGKCLKTVWNVIEPLLREYIDRSMKDPNLNPIRSFYESGGKVLSETMETDPETEKTISICIIETKNGEQIKADGHNKKMAKYKACRQAIELNLL